MAQAHRYQAYYCEENIWHLCQEARFEGQEGKVVLISNPTRSCALWYQRASPDPLQALLWDYHVIFMAHQDGGWWVWDLDTALGLPVPFSLYCRATFGPPGALPEPYRSQFRVMESAQWVSTLRSDRAHMRDQDGQWLKPPPPWPCIGQGQGPGNLSRFIDVADPFVGEIMTDEVWRQRFGDGR